MELLVNLGGRFDDLLQKFCTSKPLRDARKVRAESFRCVTDLMASATGRLLENEFASFERPTFQAIRR